MNAVTTWLLDLLDFEGRATRLEMAGHLIAYSLLALPIAFMDVLLGTWHPRLILWSLSMIYLALIFVPLLALSVRRLHDIDLPGWIVVLNFVPLAGVVVTLGQLFAPGTRGENQYGADPRAPVDTPTPTTENRVQIPEHFPEKVSQIPADESSQAARTAPITVLTTLTRSFDFQGRSSRSEYWGFFLLCFVIALLTLAVDYSMGWFRLEDGLGPVSLIFGVLAFFPNLAVCIRRLHDANLSGWLCLTNFIPMVGPLIMLGFMAAPGVEGSNRYGAAPGTFNGFPEEETDVDAGKQP